MTIASLISIFTLANNTRPLFKSSYTTRDVPASAETKSTRSTQIRLLRRWRRHAAVTRDSIVSRFKVKSNQNSRVCKAQFNRCDANSSYAHMTSLCCHRDRSVSRLKVKSDRSWCSRLCRNKIDSIDSNSSSAQVTRYAVVILTVQ